ncbi:HAMP domain-containing protein [Desulforhopalus sp. 52FAK]
MMARQRAGSFKRRQYFINKKFQTGFILKFIGVLIFGALLSVGVTMLTTQATLTSSFEGSKLVIEKTSLAILPSVVFTNIITTLIVGLIVIVVTLFISHKIAGPMFRFEKDLEEISQGNLQKHIQTRQGDQFGSVAENLNNMVGNLNEKLSQLQGELNQLSEAAAAQDLPQDFRDELDTCRRNIDSQFKL